MLLKTGNEQSIYRLILQIEAFFGEMTDEFIIAFVEAVYALCIKFSNKQSSILNFPSNKMLYPYRLTNGERLTF
jgi:coatomer protein complex subunit gamma